MDLFHLLQALILGLVQGLTEFLPISSSGHLTIIPWMFEWETPPLVFDTSLHLGTAIALLIFFYKDFLDIIRSFFTQKKSTNHQVVTSNRRLGIAIIIGMFPAGLLGFFYDKQIEQYFTSPLGNTQVFLIASALIFFGTLLWISDNLGKQTRTTEQISWKDALMVGLAQALALFPGTSRSGITMTAGLFGGLTREAAARFSFLIGAPITFAAGLYKLKDLFNISFTAETILYFLIGFLASTISGYLCIKYFLAFLRKHPVTVFTIYRIVFACIILVVLGWKVYDAAHGGAINL